MEPRNTVEILFLNQLENRLHEAKIYPQESVLIIQELTFAPNYGILFNMPKNKKKLSLLTMKDIKKQKEFQTYHLYLFSKEKFYIHKFKEIERSEISASERSIVSMNSPYHVSGGIHKTDPIVLAWGPGIPSALEGIPTIPTLDMSLYGPIIKELVNKI